MNINSLAGSGTRPESIIESRLSHLRGKIGDVRALVEDAHQKFAPVVLPSISQPASPVDQSKHPEPVKSAMVAELEANIVALDVACDRLTELLNNAQL